MKKVEVNVFESGDVVLFQTGENGRMHGMDIRKHGSGNAGSTNALRTMGVKAGAITLLGDCFKCVIAVLVVRGIFASRCPEILPLLSLYAGFGAVLGHNYPFYLGFKGGKGIAATAGMILATDLRMAAVCLVVFVVIVAVTRYVSLGSLVVTVLFLAFLEGCGYMARIAFIMDRIFRKFEIGRASCRERV